MSADEFRSAGHRLVDQIAEFLETLPARPVTRGQSPSVVRGLIGEGSLPEEGTGASELLDETARVLFENSLFNGHPRFFGYITSSAAPLGALADMLAATVNPNLGAWALSPVASEIELQTVRWIAELIGYPSDCAGVLVSGGAMANYVCFLAARRAKAGWDVQRDGFAEENPRLRVYASKETHTWIAKATDMFGLGTESIRWIGLDEELRMDTRALKHAIESDIDEGNRPIMVAATAGSVSTGVVDNLEEIGAIARAHDLWFHVDGAYGALAAVVPEARPFFAGMAEADSVAVDPHKWLYAPLEAGGVLVRDEAALRDAFTYHPDYYKFDEVDGEAPINLVDYSPQNSRGFRALKVWLGLRHAGRAGYEKMIGDDIRLAQKLFAVCEAHPELDAYACKLSITTFRYVPEDLRDKTEEHTEYLNTLNETLLTDLQEGGEVFVSNAVVQGRYYLRSCVVNFRSTEDDMIAVAGTAVRIGREVDARLKSNGRRKAKE